MIVTYARGHILRLKTIEEYLGLPASPRNYDCLPYVPEQFEQTVSDDDWCKSQIAIIEKLLKRKDVGQVVHFGDPDNEGELIVREILSYFGYAKPVKRLWCNSMIPDVIADAYYNLEEDKKYTSMYYQAMARQQFDFAWGINISRFLTKKSGINFPAGRVLVPIVKCVYDRDLAIQNFKSTKSYGIDALLQKGDWKTKITTSKPAISMPEDQKTVVEKKCAQLAAADKVVEKIETKEKSLTPKRLYCLSSFQSDFFKKYGYTLDQGLQTIQKLYEKGFVTYPRTSVEYLSSKEMRAMEFIIAKLVASGYNLQFHEKKSVFDDSKCVGGHTALTITKQIPTKEELDAMDEDEQKAYALIFNRTLSNFSRNAKIRETHLYIKAGEYQFHVVGNELLDKGFMEFEPRSIKDPLPAFSVGEKVNMSFFVAERESTPPPKITPPALLDFLKNPYADEIKTLNKEDDEEYYKLLKEGATLGTESTTATIVKNAQKYGYVALKGKSYSIQEKGVALIQLLDAFGINLYKEKNIEMNKTIVAIGNRTYTLDENKREMKKELDAIFSRIANVQITVNQDDAKVVGKCPRCGCDVVERNKSFQCSNKDCEFYIYKEDKFFARFGRKITASTAKSLLKKGEVQLNKCKSKTGKEYSIIIHVDYSGKYPNYTTSFPPTKYRKKE